MYFYIVGMTQNSGAFHNNPLLPKNAGMYGTFPKTPKAFDQCQLQLPMCTYLYATHVTPQINTITPQNVNKGCITVTMGVCTVNFQVNFLCAILSVTDSQNAAEVLEVSEYYQTRVKRTYIEDDRVWCGSQIQNGVIFLVYFNKI